MGSSKITTKDLSEPVVEALNTIDTVADQITTVDTNVNSIKSTVEGNSNKLDTINTNATNINTRLTDTRAANLDLLSNSTYGLSALKTAIGKIPTSSSGGGYMIGAYVETLTGAFSKSYSYPVYVFFTSSSGAREYNITLNGQSTAIKGTATNFNTYLIAPGITIAATGAYAADYGSAYVYKAVTA